MTDTSQEIKASLKRPLSSINSIKPPPAPVKVKRKESAGHDDILTQLAESHMEDLHSKEESMSIIIIKAVQKRVQSMLQKKRISQTKRL